jgi:hypothetical protein
MEFPPRAQMRTLVVLTLLFVREQAHRRQGPLFPEESEQ